MKSYGQDPINTGGQVSSVDELVAIANQLRQEKNLAEAESLCRNFLQRFPDQHRALFPLADVLGWQGKLDEAERVCRRGMDLTPDSSEGYNCCGKLFQARGKTTEAAECFKRAIATGSGLERSHSNLGNLFKDTGRFAEAEFHYRKAIDSNPDFPDAYNNLSILQMLQGKAAEAIKNNRKVLEINPNLPLSHSNLLFSMNFTPECSSADIFEESRRWDMRHGGPSAISAVPHANVRDPERPLRVGYVSPDFRQHSVSYFFESLLSAHNAANVKVTCYSDVARPDETTKRLQMLSHGWRECCALSHADLAELIRNDGIDILVDLTGHTANNRLKVFAAKPAPVQVNWLGSPNTTGLSSMDYRLTDDIADPAPDADPFYSEKQYRLPGVFVCYTPPKDAPAISSLPAMSNGFVTFGSFNTLAKITPQVLDLWVMLLQRVEGSRLLLKNMSLFDSETRDRYLTYLSSRGIDPGRVTMYSITRTTREHLDFYRHMDVCIDTFPFNGFTTTCEALWMGVPVVTLAGDRHGGRVSASFLTAIGLENLVARTPAGYLDLAAEIAGDLDSLAELRRTLRARMFTSPLCDTEAFAAKVEGAYRQMWREWCTRR